MKVYSVRNGQVASKMEGALDNPFSLQSINVFLKKGVIPVVAATILAGSLNTSIASDDIHHDMLFSSAYSQVADIDIEIKDIEINGQVFKVSEIVQYSDNPQSYTWTSDQGGFHSSENIEKQAEYAFSEIYKNQDDFQNGSYASGYTHTAAYERGELEFAGISFINKTQIEQIFEHTEIPVDLGMILAKAHEEAHLIGFLNLEKHSEMIQNIFRDQQALGTAFPPNDMMHYSNSYGAYLEENYADIYALVKIYNENGFSDTQNLIKNWSKVRLDNMQEGDVTHFSSISLESLTESDLALGVFENATFENVYQKAVEITMKFLEQGKILSAQDFERMPEIGKHCKSTPEKESTADIVSLFNAYHNTSKEKDLNPEQSSSLLGSILKKHSELKVSSSSLETTSQKPIYHKGSVENTDDPVFRHNMSL